ncbi:MAG: nucleoside triphosphate pyrophosphohydrolase [Eubacteriales bacterium]|nr:nucleoside triphosphate pyrophosphohydrolase [Eubacteriales bacterium]
MKLKDKYDFNELLEIIRHLRSPDGCPWDREQTHESMRGNLLEESYEVVDAIDEQNSTNLKEELGDLLLQVLLLSEIAAANQQFTLDDVITELSQKLIRRHTHVFGTSRAENSSQALANWQKQKAKERKSKLIAERFSTVPRAMPGLKRGQKVQDIAAEYNFDWTEPEAVFAKLDEEISELKEALASGKQAAITEEAGDCLLVMANLCRHLQVDAELALKQSVDKFTRRVSQMEKLMLEDGLPAGPFDSDLSNEYYERMKILEKGERI